MKTEIKLMTLIVILLLSLNCAAQSKSADQKDAKPCKMLDRSEAEKILGQRVELVTNSWKFTDNRTRFDCQYTAAEKDKASGQEINLYFMLEESPTEEEARQIYEAIRKSNENHAGVEKLNDVGDEAYAHSDKPNFHFVMARKGKFTIRLKVNKAVETTSLDELKAFAKKTAEKL